MRSDAGRSRVRSGLRWVVDALAMVLVGAVLVAGLGAPGLQATTLRAWLLEHGVAQTGATNVVSAIYLGFRAFDTLGETIVLLLAVSGVIFFVGRNASS